MPPFGDMNGGFARMTSAYSFHLSCEVSVSYSAIDNVRLGLGDLRRKQRLLDGIGVDSVVDLGKGALEIPPELEAVVFRVLEALKLPDKVNLEFRADPHAEFEGDVLMGIGPPVPSGRGSQANGV